MIPLIVLLFFFILWYFSNPVSLLVSLDFLFLASKLAPDFKTTSKRLADRKVEKFLKNITKRGVVPETVSKKGDNYPVGPILLGFFVFVVVGSFFWLCFRSEEGSCGGKREGKAAATASSPSPLAATYSDDKTIIHTGVLAEEAKKIAALYSDVLSATILDAEQCKELKMGSCLGVAAASANPLYFIHLCYKPLSGPVKTKLALVGKAFFLTMLTVFLCIVAAQEDCFYDLPYNTRYQISVLRLRKTRDEIMKCTISIYVDIYFD